MTTARALLRRLLTRGRTEAGSPRAAVAEPGVEARLEAARQRLKETIPAPEEGEAASGGGPGGPEGSGGGEARSGGVEG